jgi:5-methylcytosine-specific restriction protein A
MIELINHGVQLTKHAFRHTGPNPRSPKWSEVEKAFRSRNPFCACCGGSERLNVHHIHPFHLYPELELEESNLITLCMSMGNYCHLKVGHGDSFKAFVPQVPVLAKRVIVEDYVNRSMVLEKVAEEAKNMRMFERL